MVTKEQAMTANNFVCLDANNADGTLVRQRRNGTTRTWKTRPNDFVVPVKHGLCGYTSITRSNAHRFDVA